MPIPSLDTIAGLFLFKRWRTFCSTLLALAHTAWWYWCSYSAGRPSIVIRHDCTQFILWFMFEEGARAYHLNLVRLNWSMNREILGPNVLVCRSLLYTVYKVRSIFVSDNWYRFPFSSTIWFSYWLYLYQTRIRFHWRVVETIYSYQSACGWLEHSPSNSCQFKLLQVTDSRFEICIKSCDIWKTYLNFSLLLLK